MGMGEESKQTKKIDSKLVIIAIAGILLLAVVAFVGLNAWDYFFPNPGPIIEAPFWEHDAYPFTIMKYSQSHLSPQLALDVGNQMYDYVQLLGISAQEYVILPDDHEMPGNLGGSYSCAESEQKFSGYDTRAYKIQLSGNCQQGKDYVYEINFTFRTMDGANMSNFNQLARYMNRSWSPAMNGTAYVQRGIHYLFVKCD
jgi:hypothetical protein